MRCSTDTDNELNKELSGYQNIVVARPIAVVAEDLASCVENIPPGWGASDCILSFVHSEEESNGDESTFLTDTIHMMDLQFIVF